MKRKKNDLFYRVIFTVVLLSFVKTTVGFAAMQSGNPGNNMPSDSIILNKPDTIDLHFDFSDENGMYFFQQQESPLFLKRPANVTTSIEYDPITGQYIFKDKVGSFDYRRPSAMTFNQYQEYANESLLRNYWLERSQAASLRSSEGAMPQIEIGGRGFLSGFLGAILLISGHRERPELISEWFPTNAKTRALM